MDFTWRTLADFHGRPVGLSWDLSDDRVEVHTGQRWGWGSESGRAGSTTDWKEEILVVPNSHS